MIKPGKGSSSIKLGVAVDTLTDYIKDATIEKRGRLDVYKTSQVWFFVDTKNHRLTQLSFYSPFKEKVLGKVGIGDSVSHMRQQLGDFVMNDNVFESVENPGVSFETENNMKSDDALIVCISVSEPYTFLGDLPEHIKRNL